MTTSEGKWSAGPTLFMKLKKIFNFDFNILVFLSLTVLLRGQNTFKKINFAI